MTIEKVNLDQLETHLTIAFSSKERPYIQVLSKLTNELNEKILSRTNTKEEKLLYHALKWCLKQLGGIEKDHLVRTPRPKPVKSGIKEEL